jgi:hypothetical protein
VAGALEIMTNQIGDVAAVFDHEEASHASILPDRFRSSVKLE